MRKIFMRMIVAASFVVGLGGAVAEAADYEYTPLVREGMEWKVAATVSLPDKSDKFDYKLRLTGDTIMNSQTYKKCWYFTTCDCDTSKLVPVAYLREQDKKVFVCWNKSVPSPYAEFAGFVTSEKFDPEISTNYESQIYDFNVSVGDEWYIGTEPCGEVNAIDEEEVQGKLHKKYDLALFSIYDGIGSVKDGDLLTPVRQIPTGLVSTHLSLIYAADMTKRIFEYKQSEDVDFDDCGGGSVSKVGTSLGATIAAVDGGVTVSTPATVGVVVVEVVDMTGKVAASACCDGGRTFSVAPGVYVVTVNNGTDRTVGKVIVK